MLVVVTSNFLVKFVLKELMMSRGYTTYLADIPYSVRKELCGQLDLNAKWRDLGMFVYLAVIARMLSILSQHDCSRNDMSVIFSHNIMFIYSLCSWGTLLFKKGN